VAGEHLDRVEMAGGALVLTAAISETRRKERSRCEAWAVPGPLKAADGVIVFLQSTTDVSLKRRRSRKDRVHEGVDRTHTEGRQPSESRIPQVLATSTSAPACAACRMLGRHDAAIVSTT
jgi:hypothetical protein